MSTEVSQVDQDGSSIVAIGAGAGSIVSNAVRPTGIVFPAGDWDASTNSPPLASGVGLEGLLYRVVTAGTTTIDGVSVWNAGDYILFTGGAWSKIRGQIVNAADIANSTAAGRTILTAADAAAQRTALGATSKGVELFTAADAEAARTAISAPSTTGGNASGSWGINITGNADGSAKKLADSPGNPPHYACRAWVRFNGTGTVAIDASGNVSSITDNGTGDYTVNFTTAMPDANYSVVTTCQLYSSGGHQTNDNVFMTIYNGSSLSTGSVRVNSQYGNVNSGADPVVVCVAVFR